MSRLFPKLSKRAITWNDFWGSGEGPRRTAAGKTVSETSALRLSTVWACVTLIADAISTLTPYAQSENDLTAEVTRTKLPQWIRSPHPTLIRNEVFEQMMVSVLLWGNAYSLIVRKPGTGPNGPILGLLPLDPRTVFCEWIPDQTNPALMTPYRRYRVNGGPWLDNNEVMHIMGPSLPGCATGMSVVAHAREAVGLGLTLEEFGARYFAQGSMPKVVLTVQGQADEGKAKQIIRTFERWHQGPENWHRPAVASNGATVTPITIPPEDAQFLESREFQANDICRWFRVPSHRVNIMTKATSWGSGLAEENTAMVQNTYRPWITRLEQTLTAYTAYGEDKGTRIHLDVSDLVRGSFKEQVAAYGNAYIAGILNKNEARNGIGFPSIEGGEEFVQAPTAVGAQFVPPDPTADTTGDTTDDGTGDDGTDGNTDSTDAGSKNDKPAGKAKKGA